MIHIIFVSKTEPYKQKICNNFSTGDVQNCRNLYYKKYYRKEIDDNNNNNNNNNTNSY